MLFGAIHLPRKITSHDGCFLLILCYVAIATCQVKAGAASEGPPALKAQRRYFSYRAKLAAIVSQSSFGFFEVSNKHQAMCCKTGYRTNVPVWN